MGETARWLQIRNDAGRATAELLPRTACAGRLPAMACSRTWHGHIGAGFRERHRNGRAQPRRRAGDERDSVRGIEGIHLFPCCLEPRRRRGDSGCTLTTP